MSYLERIAACNNVCFDELQPWLIDGQRFGWIDRDFSSRLQDFPTVFTILPDGIVLHDSLSEATYQQRTAAVNQVMRQLHEQGVIDTWVGEAYPVTHAFEADAVMEVERAAASFLGIKSFGVHVNGLVQRDDGLYVWAGVRSSKKPFWPGMLDQLVAGGQPCGISLLDNVIKEAAEEASVPRELAAQAQQVAVLHYQHQGWRGLEDSCLYVYDMYLPEDFEPVNTDGEVDAFRLLPIAELAELTEHQAVFKDNCNLVNIDLLLRQGLIDASHSDYASIQQALYKE